MDYTNESARGNGVEHSADFFWLNVRRDGPQPRIFVRSFSQITSSRAIAAQGDTRRMSIDPARQARNGK